MNELRMANRDVAIHLPMNEQNWNSAGGNRVLGRSGLHIQTVLPASAEECDFDDRPEESATEPRTRVKWLSHAVVSNFAKIGERRFGSHRAEVGMRLERLKKLRGSHRFSEPKDASRPSLSLEGLQPLMDIVAFEDTVGREFSFAHAMSARVGEEQGESTSEQELRVSSHAKAVVAEAMKQNGRVSVGAMWTNNPGTENCSIGSCDGDVGQVCVEGAEMIACPGDFAFGQRAAYWMECAIGEVDACHGAESQVEKE